MSRVKKEQIYNFTFEREICGAHGRFENKSIYMVCNTTDPVNRFKVMNLGEKIGVFVELDKAIDLYNSL